MAHFKFSLLRISACTLVLAGTGFSLSPAQAGFEWKPGAKAPAAKDKASDTAPAMPALKQGQVDADKLPAPGAAAYPTLPPGMAAMAEEPAAPPAPDHLPGHSADRDAAHVPAGPEDAAVIDPAPPAPMPMGTSIPALDAESGYTDTVGFGSDIPLALALRQIVPADYSFIFDKGVRQSTKISWTGGKAWDAVLGDALKPAGYAAAIEGNTVHVGKANKMKTADTTPPASPAMTQSPMTQSAPRPPVAAAPLQVSRTPDLNADAPRLSRQADAGQIVPSPDKADAAPEPAAQVPSGPDGAAESPSIDTVENNPSGPPTAPAVTAQREPQQVREVYVRRNSTKPEVAERVPGKPVAVTGERRLSGPPEEQTEEQPQRSFWSRLNPAHWGGDDDGDSATAKMAPPAGNDRVAGAAAAGAASSDQEKPPILLTRPPGSVPAIETEHLASSDNHQDGIKMPPAAKRATLNTAEIRSWEAAKGDSLRTVLQRWSDTANVQLYWVPSQDYKLTKAVKMEGNYTDAVAEVLSSYGDTGPRPLGRLHPNMPDGPAVLIIEPSTAS